MNGHTAPANLPASLIVSLDSVGNWLQAAGNPPHAIIGSAALVMLLGGQPEGVTLEAADVDLILTAEGAARLLRAARQDVQPGSGTSAFRSAVFGRVPVAGGLPVEIMGGFDCAGPAGWQPVWPVAATPGWIPAAGNVVHIATPQALADLFRLFGRPKDLARLAMMTRYLPCE